MADQQAPSGPSLRIEKIYLKDLSLENPGAPQSFSSQETPQVEVSLRSRGEQIEEAVFECVLTITVTAKHGDKTLFLVEAAQAGIFRISGVPLSEVQPVHLDPINFEQLYQQQLASMQQSPVAAQA